MDSNIPALEITRLELPFEVWGLVVDELASSNAISPLKALGVTCHALQLPCQKIIFAKVSVFVRSTEWAGPEADLRNRQLLDILIRSPRVANCIGHLNIRVGGQRCLTDSDAVPQIIFKLPSVTCLHLDISRTDWAIMKKTPMASSAIDYLFSLPTLNELLLRKVVEMPVKKLSKIPNLKCLILDSATIDIGNSAIISGLKRPIPLCEIRAIGTGVASYPILNPNLKLTSGSQALTISSFRTLDITGELNEATRKTLLGAGAPLKEVSLSLHRDLLFAEGIKPVAGTLKVLRIAVYEDFETLLPKLCEELKLLPLVLGQNLIEQLYLKFQFRKKLRIKYQQQLGRTCKLAWSTS
ncbi:hypothetical protein CPB83DRAFT_203332 [Crepidotus variabilis]|uniref:Uncharacterized protein n=1 Tax=Crepidotus variabilis TaxID=179855 RepID=A0A9P6JWI9_9AGAR|nr:hypothetical protein CPB83DRAFT_203332 [Crepidotus variabilis]